MIAPNPIVRVSWVWEHAGLPWLVHAAVRGAECEDLCVVSPDGAVEMTVEDVGGTTDDEERLSAEAVRRAEDERRGARLEAAFQRAKGRG